MQKRKLNGEEEDTGPQVGRDVPSMERKWITIGISLFVCTSLLRSNNQWSMNTFLVNRGQDPIFPHLFLLAICRLLYERLPLAQELQISCCYCGESWNGRKFTTIYRPTFLLERTKLNRLQNSSTVASDKFCHWDRCLGGGYIPATTFSTIFLNPVSAGFAHELWVISCHRLVWHYNFLSTLKKRLDI